MSFTIKGLVVAGARALPTLATLSILAGVGYLGHRTGWKIPSSASVFGAAEETSDTWCKDHGVPEASCVICRGLKITATPPSKRTAGAVEAAIIEPPVEDGQPRQVVQVPSSEALRLAGVETGAAETRAIAEVVEANAESGYDMTHYAQVAARAPGHAFAVRVQAGQHVTKGDVLALIDSVEVGKAKAEFLQSAALLATRRAVLERVRSSTAAGFRNQADLFTAEADVNDASIGLFNTAQALINLGLPSAKLSSDAVPAERDVQFLGLSDDIVAELDPARATANLLPVIAPLDGIVVTQNVVPGEMVETTRPLFVVADTSRMWVTADLSLGQVGQVRLGQEMSFTPDGWSGEPFSGKLSWISTEVNEKTRAVQIRAEVANPDGRLLAHAFGRARIVVHSIPAAVVVSEEAVQPEGDEHVVLVRLNDEVFRPRIVRLGLRTGGVVEVLSGLSPGEVIATAGSYFLAAQANRGKLGEGCCVAE